MKWTLAILVLLFQSLVLGAVFAQDGTFLRYGLLRDVPSEVDVLVEYVPEDAEAIGITLERIENRVRVRLIEAGINPLDDYADDGSYLYVQVDVLDSAAKVRVEFNRTAFVGVGDDIYRVIGSVWDQSSLLDLSFTPSSEDGDFVMRSLERLMDGFISDYFRANPPPW